MDWGQVKKGTGEPQKCCLSSNILSCRGQCDMVCCHDEASIYLQCQVSREGPMNLFYSVSWGNKFFMDNSSSDQHWFEFWFALSRFLRSRTARSAPLLTLPLGFSILIKNSEFITTKNLVHSWFHQEDQDTCWSTFCSIVKLFGTILAEIFRMFKRSKFDER